MHFRAQSPWRWQTEISLQAEAETAAAEAHQETTHTGVSSRSRHGCLVMSPCAAGPHRESKTGAMCQRKPFLAAAAQYSAEASWVDLLLPGAARSLRSQSAGWARVDVLLGGAVRGHQQGRKTPGLTRHDAALADDRECTSDRRVSLPPLPAFSRDLLAANVRSRRRSLPRHDLQPPPPHQDQHVKPELWLGKRRLKQPL